MFDKLKHVLNQWKKPFILAVIAVIIVYLIWLFTTFQGSLMLEKITGNYTPPPNPHTIVVYEGGVKIASYTGLYSIEQFDGHIVLIDHEDNSKIAIYGDAAVILDETEDVEGEN